MDVRDTVGAVTGRRHPIGLALLRPTGASRRGIPSGPNSSKGERAVGEVGQDALDAVELGVTFGVGGLLPGLVSLRIDQRAKGWSRFVGRVVAVATSFAIAGTRLPPVEARTNLARRKRAELVLPRRTICCNRSPS